MLGKAMSYMKIRRHLTGQIRTVFAAMPLSRSRRTSVWRLIGGALILAGVAYSLRNIPSAYGLFYVIAYLVSALVFAAIGLWLLINTIWSLRNESKR
jgi:hypothetical protein